MLRVLACVTQEHEPWLVALAFAVCLAGSLIFVRLVRGALVADSGSRRRWVRTAAVAGGGTIWATHFIAMLAHRSGVPLAFDVGLTFASLAIAMGMTWGGIQVAVARDAGRWRLAMGGVVVGAGIALMHYVGLMALAIPGALVFDPVFAAGSVAIGCVLAGAAAQAAGREGGYQAAAVVLFAASITGHHFTSLAGTAIVFDGRPIEGWVPDGPWLAVLVAVAAVSILAVCAAVSMVEQNLSLRVANEARLRELSVQSLRFQAALDNMAQGLCLFDARGRLIVHNPAFEAMFGAPVGGAAPVVVPEGVLSRALFGPPGADHGAAADTHAHELADGRVIRVSRQAVAGAGWVATYDDVTERRRARDQLSHMARHDALTGLPNRVRFREQMEHLAASARHEGELAVLCLDLDGFKAVNDTLGHAAGDELLRAVAGRLQDCTRETDMVARLGGDEFAVIQVEVQQPGRATALSERLMEALLVPFEIRGHPVSIGTSIGIALAGPGAGADELLRNGEIALHRAKAEGRGRWCFFEPGMDAEVLARRALEQDLRRALGLGQFEVFYQPLIDAGTERLTGFEALLRWNHPERGLVAPASFIPLAEEIGLIKGLGAWVLERACADALGWPDHIKVAVNLSPVQFVGTGLVGEVEHALVASGLAASRLELEITESVLLQDSAATLDVLHRLRALGACISMDDFGTGYSSLSYLRCFPFDKIKIDQSFVRDLATEGGSIEIIRAVVGLGQALNMEVLAEGVETAEQLRTLQGEGCNELQGFLFSKPRPLRELGEVIATYCPGGDVQRMAV